MGSASSPDRKRKLLLVDDDENFRWAMQRAFEQRGYEMRVAASVAEAIDRLQGWQPEFAAVDLRMPGTTGLALISRLRSQDPRPRIVVLTGYASIATAIEAIKLGATHYLAKPVDADAVEAAFERTLGVETVPASESLLSVDRLAWEYIQRVLAEKQGNVSATARALHMHRRTLQRKLNKHPTQR